MVSDEEKGDEEEEDLKDVPLFYNSEEHVEPFHLDESFHIPPPPPPDGDSFAPQEEEAIENFL